MRYVRSIESRAPIGMVHYESALAAELVPNGKGRTNCAACVACRRLYVHAPKRRHPPHLAVSHGIHRASAGQREVCQAGAFLQNAKKMKECFLIHRLSRAGDVAVALLEWVAWQAPRPQQLLKRWRKQIVEIRGAVSPLISDVLAM